MFCLWPRNCQDLFLSNPGGLTRTATILEVCFEPFSNLSTWRFATFGKSLFRFRLLWSYDLLCYFHLFPGSQVFKIWLICKLAHQWGHKFYLSFWSLLPELCACLGWVEACPGGKCRVYLRFFFWWALDFRFCGICLLFVSPPKKSWFNRRLYKIVCSMGTKTMMSIVLCRSGARGLCRSLPEERFQTEVYKNVVQEEPIGGLYIVKVFYKNVAQVKLKGFCREELYRSAVEGFKVVRRPTRESVGQLAWAVGFLFQREPALFPHICLSQCSNCIAGREPSLTQVRRHILGFSQSLVPPVASAKPQEGLWRTEKIGNLGNKGNQQWPATVKTSQLSPFGTLAGHVVDSSSHCVFFLVVVKWLKFKVS